MFFMKDFLFLAFFSGIAIALGFLISFYLLFVRNEQRFKLKFLGFLFMALSLRIVKSILFFSGEIPNLAVAIGYLGLSCIGPLLWLYFKYFDVETQKLAPKDLLHFIPALIGMVHIALSQNPVASFYYLYTTCGLFIYVLAAWFKFRQYGESKAVFHKWNSLLILTVGCFGGIFLFQFYTDTMYNYAMGAVVAAIMVFGLLVFLLNNPVLFPSKKKSIAVDSSLINRIKSELNTQKIYQEPSLTLDKFAKKLNHPAYLISRIIKQEYGMTFPELINYCRIQQVAAALSNGRGKNVKIEALAYEAGFNTPSTFYTAFKKFTGMNPTEFQKTPSKVQAEVLSNPNLAYLKK
ncbi:AraC family transcriptional regulator [Flagellimonas alvinocaridis]|uniref:AraC family transcriptional regulator n=2 Tax=Flagellimonas alvinocaridis TaxID=2530200 RepID=A0A4S8RVD8_9FLAO|nr:AraC family transcriptional regulator [Allomuricauda alvinocaridis]